MDFLTSKIKPMYFKYLAAAFGSALISSIYGVVDMAMVGQYQGPEGTAALATKAVILGGIFNVFGDYFFVFVLNMGIMGAGLATAMGSVFSLLVMLSHFWNKKNTLRFVKPVKLFPMLKSICVTGFSTFFIDVAMGILTMLFNRQILKYLGTDALSVYGIIINISTFVQCCAYSIGQASQPMISTNYGAGKEERIRQILKYALGTAAVFELIWTALALLVPNLFVRIFMTPTQEILTIAPGIIRGYGISFLMLPFNIFSTYYFQALMRPRISLVVSVSRGAVISGILICVLPAVIGADAIWFAMTVTELLVAVYVTIRMIQCTKTISVEKRKHKDSGRSNFFKPLDFYPKSDYHV